MAVFQRAQKKGERVYLFGAPAKATVEAEEEACGLATKNEDQSNIFLTRRVQVQVNLFQKHLFLHQLTHNATKDCSFNYEFST